MTARLSRWLASSDLVALIRLAARNAVALDGLRARLAPMRWPLQRFRRIWTLYIAYCEAGFAERRICDIQLLLTKPRSPFAVGERAASWARIGRQELPVSG